MEQVHKTVKAPSLTTFLSPYGFIIWEIQESQFQFLLHQMYATTSHLSSVLPRVKTISAKYFDSCFTSQNLDGEAK